MPTPDLQERLWKAVWLYWYQKKSYYSGKLKKSFNSSVKTHECNGQVCFGEFPRIWHTSPLSGLVRTMMSSYLFDFKNTGMLRATISCTVAWRLTYEWFINTDVKLIYCNAVDTSGYPYFGSNRACLMTMHTVKNIWMDTFWQLNTAMKHAQLQMNYQCFHFHFALVSMANCYRLTELFPNIS